MDKFPDRLKPSKTDSRHMGGLYHGLQFAITAVGGLAAGYWLDQRWLPAPLGMIGGLFLGALLGMYIMVRSVGR